MKVPMGHRLMTSSSMTSRDYDVVLVTSQSSKSSHSETRNRINCLCRVDLSTHTITIVEHCDKDQLTRFRIFWENKHRRNPVPQITRKLCYRKDDRAMRARS